MTTASPGWLPDPTGRHEHRYWNGSDWTDQVADGGVASADPLQQVAPIDSGTPFTSPSAAPPPAGAEPGPMGAGPNPYAPGGPGDGTVPPDLGGPGLSPGGAPPSGPSTGLLVGFGLVVVVLFAAIVYVLMDDDGDSTATSNTGSTETTPSDTTATTEPVDATTTSEATTDTTTEDPLGISSTVDQLVADFGGQITEDDARCMIAEAASWALSEGYTGNESFEEMPQEDQLAVTSAMLSGVDAEALVESLLADGMIAEGATQEQADCAAEGIVDAVGVDALLAAVVADPIDPIGQMTAEDQDAVINATTACL